MTPRTQKLNIAIAAAKAQLPPTVPEGSEIGEEEPMLEMERRRK